MELDGPLAQWIEQPPSKRLVAGSSPAWPVFPTPPLQTPGWDQPQPRLFLDQPWDWLGYPTPD